MLTVSDKLESSFRHPDKLPIEIIRKGRFSDPDERRQRLLNVAHALFIRRGFHRTSIKEIAMAAEMAVGQIYRDFSSKDEIVATLCDQHIRNWLKEKELEEIIASGDPMRARAWILDFCGRPRSQDDVRMLSEIIAEVGRSKRISEIVRTCRNHVQEWVQKALQLAGWPGDASAVCDLILARDLMQATKDMSESTPKIQIFELLIVQTAKGVLPNSVK